MFILQSSIRLVRFAQHSLEITIYMYSGDGRRSNSKRGIAQIEITTIYQTTIIRERRE